VEDGAGAILLPGLVEAHTHIDKTLWGMGWVPNSAGPRLIDKIDNERAVRAALGIEPGRQSARQVVQSLRKGTTQIRTHVDVDTVVGLSGIEGVLATRERYADVMDIEIVAFPQSGMLVRQGTVELLEESMRLGADVVGGLDPCGIDRDPKGHLDAVFALAQKFGKPIDIHLHELALLGAFSMELIFERTRALGMEGQVVISHAFCLGDPDLAMVDALLDEIAALDIAIMTTGTPSRPVPPVARLAKRGIRICAGSDGIRDTWGPYGNGDMLERAMQIGMRNNFRRDEEVELGPRHLHYRRRRDHAHRRLRCGGRLQRRPRAGGGRDAGRSRRQPPGAQAGAEARPRRRAGWRGAGGSAVTSVSPGHPIALGQRDGGRGPPGAGGVGAGASWRSPSSPGG
jgi:cytosine deaminase